MLRPDWILQPESLWGVVVRVCENPSLVEAAADMYGAAALPLICTYGRPSGAAWALLRGVARAGARVKVGGDRDPAGRAISGDLIDGLPGAEPWLAEVAGLYEEDRLPVLLADLTQASRLSEGLDDFILSSQIFDRPAGIRVIATRRANPLRVMKVH
jgi:Protein of unknown function C-terminus (DUF2399)